MWKTFRLLRNAFIIGLLFWCALRYQDNHRDFAPPKPMAARTVS
jgi:hypothetical protein